MSLGKIEDRTTPDDITVFESLGLAGEDLAAARHVFRRAVDTGRGTRVELGGRRLEES